MYNRLTHLPCRISVNEVENVSWKATEGDSSAIDLSLSITRGSGGEKSVMELTVDPQKLRSLLFGN